MIVHVSMDRIYANLLKSVHGCLERTQLDAMMISNSVRDKPVFEHWLILIDNLLKSKASFEQAIAIFNEHLNPDRGKEVE